MLYMPDKLINQLETYRLDHKITQEELADKLGVAFSTVNRWLNDKNKPSKIQIHQIKKLLDKAKTK
ncbi:MAG: hypothetical protein A2987_01210 [Omnitrophica bacterium RIFCSPLOWO2_01_FULL_45_10]|nr:MAG: hypothetical protein A2987_01210 [Omnitrophica bacterium RIFCSPLOWO2_01_FULL_45_10]